MAMAMTMAVAMTMAMATGHTHGHTMARYNVYGLKYSLHSVQYEHRIWNMLYTVYGHDHSHSR